MKSQHVTPELFPAPAKRHDQNDSVRGFVMFAAIVMFIVIGGQVGGQAARTFMGYGQGTDSLMVSALLLNIALILLTWRRTSALSDEILVYRQAEVRAQYLAMTDPLTNLFNRRALKQKTTELSARASRCGKSIAFLMIDLDGFKKVNDIFGHDSGDLLLREVADRMRETVPPSSIIARLGGDEFGICMMFEPDDPEFVAHIAQNLAEALARPVLITDSSQAVTASIGISRSKHDGDAVDLLMRRADLALYAAKKNGRNRFLWFDSYMEIEPRSPSLLEGEILAVSPMAISYPILNSR